MIRDYVTETRLLSDEIPDESVRSVYEPMVFFCEKILDLQLGDARPKTEVIVTYSAQRKCELINLNGTNFLVYDKNLGQTINTFNRIVFFAKDSIKAYRPLFNLMLDEAIASGEAYPFNS